MRMYDQMYSNIDRQLNFAIKSLFTFFTSSIVVFYIEKNEIIPFSIGVAFAIMVNGWLIAHLIDANYWFFRNLHIVANIEKQFLRYTDLREIHCYFAQKESEEKKDIIEYINEDKSKTVKEKKYRWQTSLKIHFIFALAIASSFFAFWIIKNWNSILENFFDTFKKDYNCIPIVVTIISFYLCNKLWRKRKKECLNFIKESPGKEVVYED